MNGLNEFKRYQNRYPIYVVLNAALSLLFIDYAEFYSAPQVEQWQRGGYLRKRHPSSGITPTSSWLNLGSIKVLGKWAIIIVLRMGVNQKSDWEHKVNLKNFLCPVYLLLGSFCALPGSNGSKRNYDVSHWKVAEEVRFELTVGFHLRRFSSYRNS